MALHRLIAPLKNYAWGSPEFIPHLLGKTPDSGLPVAEMWLGAHPSASSILAENGRSLRELIASDPDRTLGRGVALAQGELPFLLKVLAAAEPLSLQAHPSAAQAKLGFERENSLALPLDSPLRNYRDPLPKPELLCALTPFKAICGFRPADEIAKNLKDAGVSGFLRKYDVFELHPNPRTFADLSMELLNLGQDTLSKALAALDEALPGNVLDPEIRDCILGLKRHHPGDRGLLAPLYLNIFQLEPGEALFLEAGVLHAYLEGAGIEIMGNSDNVLRGGLSPKHIDSLELARVLDFRPYPGGILKPENIGSGLEAYRTPAREFELRHLRLDGCGVVLKLNEAPLILLCEDGNVSLKAAGESLSLKKGESAFVSAEPERLELEGVGKLWLATLPLL